MGKLLTERLAFSAGKVDRSGAYPVVREVLLCGPESANRRRYRAEAFAGDRIKRYEARPVFLNHGKGAREYQDKIATVESPRHRADGMPVGDLAVNPKHPLAEAFLWDAEHKPRSCGMSHVANCETTTAKDGWEEITEVVSVESVDIVTDPATTKGLHEGKTVAKTVKQLAEWVRQHARSNARQKSFAKLVAEMDGMDGATLDAAPPAEDADPSEGIKDAFATAVMHLAKQALDGEIDSKDFAKKVKKLVDSHAEVNGGDSDTSADDTSDDSGDDSGDDMPKESRPQPWDVLRECQAQDYTPTATELEVLAGVTSAEKRKAFVTEQKAKAANAAAQKPQSAARTPGASAAGKTVVKEEKAVPTGGKEFAAFIRD